MQPNAEQDCFGSVPGCMDILILRLFRLVTNKQKATLLSFPD